jgi:hypothetical protein
MDMDCPDCGHPWWYHLDDGCQECTCLRIWQLDHDSTDSDSESTENVPKVQEVGKGGGQEIRKSGGRVGGHDRRLRLMWEYRCL